MTLIDNYFPFDVGAGQAATSDRWRHMARLWYQSGVVPGYANQCRPTIAGSVVTIDLGALWIDGFYGEITIAKTVSVSGSGQVVARMDPTGRDIILVFVSGQNSPTQNLTGIYEVPLAQVASGVLTDIRQFSVPLRLPTHTVVAETLMRPTGNSITASTNATTWLNWWAMGITKVRPDTLIDFTFQGSAWASVGGGYIDYGLQITGPNPSAMSLMSRFYFNNASEHHTIVGGVPSMGQELVNARFTGYFTLVLAVRNQAATFPSWHIDTADYQFLTAIERMP